MTHPGSDEKHLELKEGAVILIALALLIGFIFLLSDFSFKSKKEPAGFFKIPAGFRPAPR